MKYNHTVKYKGVYYPTGADVPVGSETKSNEVVNESANETINEAANETVDASNKTSQKRSIKK